MIFLILKLTKLLVFIGPLICWCAWLLAVQCINTDHNCWGAWA